MAASVHESVGARSKRRVSRLLVKILPLHTLRELKFEIQMSRLRLTHRRIDASLANERELLVNVGCGPNGLPGWVNIDCYSGEGVTCVRDCRVALPLTTGSARGIFTEHFLEHLDYYEEAPRFLQECRRVLAPGGLIRIIVPDGAKHLQAYLDEGWTSLRTLTPLVSWDPEGEHQRSTSQGPLLPFKTKMEVINFHLTQMGEHRFSYDFETLSLLLAHCGFESIVQRQFRESSMPEMAIDQEFRALESLVVEAISPRSNENT